MLSLNLFDMPMTRPPEEDCMNDLIRAKYTTKYLEEFAEYELHNGAALRERIQSNMDVQIIRKVDGHWQLKCSDNNTLTKPKMTFVSKKLMMANGQFSLPDIASFPGADDFKARILHCIGFGNRLSSLTPRSTTSLSLVQASQAPT
jgi:dimethylaniline monooxygenase (N-oxide forming)